MDIAYAFKRQYEDSIIKFLRNALHQNESSKIAGDSWYSQPEECLEEDEEQQDTMPIPISNVIVTQLPYTLVNVEHEIDIEEMDTKCFLKLSSSDTPAPMATAVESLNGDGSNKEAHEETVSDGDQCNSLRNNTDDESVSELLNEQEIVQEPSSMLSWNNDDDMERKFVARCTPCTSQSISIESENFDPRIDDEIRCHQKVNLPEFPPTNNVTDNPLQSTTTDCWNVASVDTNQRIDGEIPWPLNENLSEFQPTNNEAETHKPQQSSETECSNATSIDPTAECKERKFGFHMLRSSSYRIGLYQKSLPRGILHQIYTYHHGHPVKPYKCDVCFRWFKTKGHIKTHRMRHIERDKKILCRKCRLTFLTKPHFKNHKCNLKFY